MQAAPATLVCYVPVVLLLTLFSGCGSSRSSVGTPPPKAPKGASSVYILQQGNPYLINPTLSYVLQFSATAEGAATPVSMLSLPTAFVAYSVAVDSTGQIYVGGSQESLDTMLQKPEILVYAADSSGTPEPLRTIEPGSNGLPVSLAVDSSGQLYVANTMSTNNNIAVYSSTANGQAMPIRLIQGALTQINNLESLTIDATGNIYATAQTNANTPPGLLLVFPSSANGNVAPARVLTNASGIFNGVAVDSGLNVYAVEEFATGTNAAIVEFAAGASGAATPIRSISGPATDIGIPGGLRSDNAGNLFVTNELVTSKSISFSVLGFNSVASGNIQPTIQFSSTEWTAGAPELALQ